MDDEKLRLFDDYDFERYALWRRGHPGEFERDDKGHIVWHDGPPSNKDWDRVGMVTVDYEFQGEGHYRNIVISPGRPLDPYGSDQEGYKGPHKGGRYGPEFYYDLDDLVTNWFWDTDTP